MQRQGPQDDQRHLPVEDQQDNCNDDQLEKLFRQRVDDPGQKIEQRDIADDIADEFTCSVSLVEAQGKALKMFEHFLPDIDDQTDTSVIDRA